MGQKWRVRSLRFSLIVSGFSFKSISNTHGKYTVQFNAHGMVHRISSLASTDASNHLRTSHLVFHFDIVQDIWERTHDRSGHPSEQLLPEIRTRLEVSCRKLSVQTEHVPVSLLDAETVTKTRPSSFRIHSSFKCTTVLQPPCIYSMSKNESPRAWPRLRCVWDTGPCIWDLQAELDAFDGPVECKDTEYITLSLASRVQIDTCQCYRVFRKLVSSLHPGSSIVTYIRSVSSCRTPEEDLS